MSEKTIRETRALGGRLPAKSPRKILKEYDRLPEVK
jgi:hypothetical protein